MEGWTGTPVRGKTINLPLLLCPWEWTSKKYHLQLTPFKNLILDIPDVLGGTSLISLIRQYVC
jgi:hypothetical protein